MAWNSEGKRVVEGGFKNAIVIVDMLNDFVHPDGVLAFPQARDIIDPIIDIIDNRDPMDNIIFVCDVHEEGDKEFEKFPPHCLAGTWGSQIIDELKDRVFNRIPFLYIPKYRYSAFFDTPLDAVIHEYIRPKEVIVVGVCTSICVMDTVGGFVNRDYDVTVPSNCVADFDNSMHDMSLERMKNIYGAKIL